MKPVLSPQQAVELDRATQARGIPGVLLMERAGLAVARACVDLMGGAYGRRAVVVCGKGNNGGDGLVAARHLTRWGVRVTVLFVETPQDLAELAAMNLSRLAEVGLRVRVLTPPLLAAELGRSDLAVDAIFGTGFHGGPKGRWGEAIAGLNTASVPVVAVDIPSGVNGATGVIQGEATWCELTVTFGAAKTGAVLLPGAERAGAVRVADIGFPDELMDADTFLTEPADVVAVLPARAADAHKRASGVLLVVAGSRSMTGAARLIAEAAYRVGAGLVVVAVPQGILPVVQSGLAEAVFLPLPETADGTASSAALGAVLDALGGANALAIGPGLTDQDETAGFVRDLIAACPVPAVVDADALNAFSGRAAHLAERQGDAVLTPHMGELARLTGLSAQTLEQDRLVHARAMAARASAVTLVKGSRTVIAEPDGRVRINPTGSPVLATAGSGDVLTGMIGGFLARGLRAADAAAAGAYLHGLAGVLAGRTTGEGTVAGDIVRHVPGALARLGAP